MSATFHVKTESERRYCSRTGEPRDDFSVWINEGNEHLAIVAKRVVRSDGAGTRLETREEVEARAYAIVGQLNAQYLLADLFEALTPPKSGCDCDMDGDRPLPCVFHRFEHQMRAAIARCESPTPRWPGPSVVKTRAELDAMEAEERERMLRSAT